jgi:hypothetical protein
MRRRLSQMPPCRAHQHDFKGLAVSNARPSQPVFMDFL